MQDSERFPNNVLFVVDVEDGEYLDLSRESRHWNIVPEILDFNELHGSIDRLEQLAKAHDIDFLLYSQNDQVAKRIGIGRVHQQLGLGYSSVSAIDRGDDDAVLAGIAEYYATHAQPR